MFKNLEYRIYFKKRQFCVRRNSQKLLQNRPLIFDTIFIHPSFVIFSLINLISARAESNIYV
ncbi:hypothetical protein LEP1GSC151_1717 [Leptospira interrogans serovar Grippotyphosa str. LT2186]|uniref:Uncharacterized protein n=2 Tax=Leptospira interrogans TaxID=173 RepID=M3FYN2_LEPIR|nr:hypothetical protein A6J42_09195 [Leptospira interrogans serovar Copenhageni]ASV06564.1 hypothetical protein B2G47_12295 [Leptospira interrogans serovar Canicola]EKO05236.1 hypothetical protein LEP1GSC077_4287 [Leptospira interrogans str. C10069]EKO24512.1 hypothetical protein LEP1GSC104_0783 [Leptospira interrogans str. UI 12621]EKR19330.1 hypothetical protein LEP1GSC019_0016 [Leptospira interrogans serovar Pyrogenes str. 2006006960]EMG12649.1 hypothetical protein LEP1GSC151_1717 [Leptospi